MMDILSWLFFVMFIVVLIGVVIMLIRGTLRSGTSSTSFGDRLFAQKPVKRLGVIEEANLDGRRKLILLRRDGVEHLVMIGGPTDVIIESGIEAGAGQATGSQSGAGDKRAQDNRDRPRVVHANSNLPAVIGK